MFDQNAFKKSIKQWIRNHPEGSLNDIIDFCEDQIPAAQYAANKWLIEQTVDWYKHILAHRKSAELYANEEDDPNEERRTRS